jgi:hypothetical protein
MMTLLPCPGIGWQATAAVRVRPRQGADLGAAVACFGHREPLPHGAAAALSSAAQSLPCPPTPAIMPLTRSSRPHYDGAVSADLGALLTVLAGNLLGA